MPASVNTKYGWQPAKKLLQERKISVAEVARQTGLTYNQVIAPLYGATLPSPRLQAWLEKTLDQDVRYLFTEHVVRALIDEMYQAPNTWLILGDRHGREWTFDLRTPQTSKWERDGEEPLDLVTLLQRHGPITTGRESRHNDVIR